jgi:hypothetical protein
MTHLERRGTIDLPLPIERAFPLFTPLGEKRWVEDWDPTFLHPPDGETQEGRVFTTAHGGETTLWSCTAFEPAAHHARYVRVTPTSRFGFVDVRCEALAAERTRVHVGYSYTALSEQGEADLAALTDAAFAEMLDDWRAMIDRHIQGGR